MLDIDVTGSGTVHVRVCGELEMQHAPRLRAVINALLHRGDVTGIDLDLAAVTLLDATGAGAIIVAQRLATNVRVALRLTTVSPSAATVLTLTGAAGLLPA